MDKKNRSTRLVRIGAPQKRKLEKAAASTNIPGRNLLDNLIDHDLPVLVKRLSRPPAEAATR